MPLPFRFGSIAALATALACVIPFGATATAATVTLAPIADTSLFELAPFNNLGASQSIAVGVTANSTRARGLVKFDIANQLPANAVISSARLTLPIVRQGTFVEPSIFDLHRVNVNWGEGDKDAGLLTGTGSPATTGEACWATRVYPLTFWREGGGQAGSDYVEIASASADTTSPITFNSTPELVADVQSWVSNPTSNFGWLLKDRDEGDVQTARRLGSREHPTAASRPQLTIEYTAPVTSTIRITDVANSDGNLCFRFDATAGKTYTIERRENVGAGAWTIIQTIPTVAAAGPITVCDPIGLGPQFYRVAER